MNEKISESEPLCGDTVRCDDHGEDLRCIREPSHKGFHMDAIAHRWDEHGDMSHD